jgi:hypothetical protein
MVGPDRSHNGDDWTTVHHPGLRTLSVSDIRIIGHGVGCCSVRQESESSCAKWWDNFIDGMIGRKHTGE